VIAAKLDEDLPADLAETLKAHEIDTVTVHEQGWAGTADELLFARIQPEGGWLFTADKGFSDIRRYPPGSHRGIVFFRAERESRAAYLRLTLPDEFNRPNHHPGGAGGGHSSRRSNRQTPHPLIRQLLR
jgi:hypothetical protein